MERALYIEPSVNSRRLSRCASAVLPVVKRSRMTLNALGLHDSHLGQGSERLKSKHLVGIVSSPTIALVVMNES